MTALQAILLCHFNTDQHRRPTDDRFQKNVKNDKNCKNYTTKREGEARRSFPDPPRSAVYSDEF